MSDDEKTKEQLLGELTKLHHRVNELEASETEREKAERALRESEMKFRSLVQTAVDAIITTDAEGNIVSWNKGAQVIFGYTEADVLSKPLSLIMPGQATSVYNPGDPTAVCKTGQFRVFGKVDEAEGVKKDGSEVPLELSVTTWKTGDGIFFTTIVRDITERKHSEEALKQSVENLRKILEGTVYALASTAEKRDPYTAGHQQRVARLASAVGNELGLSADEVEGIKVAGTLHDIGKISVPVEILAKPIQLTELEFSIIELHPQAGYDILKSIEFPWPIAQIVLQHHERLDGSGYPTALTGDDILMEARILGVADTVEAMASHRPYRPALGIDMALVEIIEKKGLLYDTAAVDACVKLFKEKSFSLGIRGENGSFI